MATAVVFAFAVADGLPPVPGAAPYDVLARQLPRLLVSHLNGDADRGVRFFPFLGPVDGQRNFLRLHDQFEPEVLAQLHKQGDLRLLCDGMFRAGVLLWRIVDGSTLRVLSACELPFDPRSPLDVLTRLEFEVMGELGWTGRPRPPCALTGEALGWWLVLKDALLRREANLGDAVSDPLRPARRCVELAPADVSSQELVLDFASMLLRRGEEREAVGLLLVALAATGEGGVAMLERLAALLLAAAQESVAADVAVRVARLAPHRPELVERAAAQLFRLHRDEEVRQIVGFARQRGVASPAATAQLAAVCDRAQDLATRDALVAELTGLPDLPVPVARLVVSFLLEDERADLARRIVERALVHEPAHAMLHFELGRACLLLDDDGSAAAALRQALLLGLAPLVATQAQRYLRLSMVPGLWAGAQRVEKAIEAGQLNEALAAARDLLRSGKRAAEVWFLLGIVRHKLGQCRRAERALRRAVRFDATFADAHNRLGVLLLASGRLQEGRDCLQRAHELAPADSAPLLHLAQACALLGRQSEAEQHIEAAERAGADPKLVQAVRRELATRH